MRGTIIGDAAPRAALYLPSGYKSHRHTKVTGTAATGEVSPNGLVAETEDWEGRVEAVVAPATVHWMWDRGARRFRPMTMTELRERGLFIDGAGPTGVQRIREGRQT